jgi:hypothetical protein
LEIFASKSTKRLECLGDFLQGAINHYYVTPDSFYFYLDFLDSLGHLQVLIDRITLGVFQLAQVPAVINLTLIRPYSEVPAKQWGNRIFMRHLSTDNFALAKDAPIFAHQCIANSISQVHSQIRNLNGVPTSKSLHMHNPGSRSLTNLHAQLCSQQSRPVRHPLRKFTGTSPSEIIS